MMMAVGGGTAVAVVVDLAAAAVVSSVEFALAAFDLALGLLDDDEANVLDQNVRNIRFATFIGGGLSTLWPRLLVRKTCCNVVGIREEKPLGEADDASAVEFALPPAVVLELSDGRVALGGRSPTVRFAFRISTA